jgi:1-acyl-sn-glycerol-3-phosphate acyltransferase
MTDNNIKNPTEYRIKYPRKLFERGFARTIGRIILPIAFSLNIRGKERFPKRGPLLVVGNHTAIMETVMLYTLTPWQIEMLGSIDIPHERLTDLISRFIGYIPIRRGRMERESMEQALDVLRQDGVVGIFPEGGIWEAGGMSAQPGVSWLSFRSGAPVLPIGFSGTIGALGKAINLKRPKLTMNIGKLIPAALLPKGKPRKQFFVEYATQVLTAIRSLLPQNDPSIRSTIRDEHFELDVTAKDQNEQIVNIPEEFKIKHDVALAKVLHRPGILKIFKKNLKMPVESLQSISENHNPENLITPLKQIMEYLKSDNPYLFSYRFGPKQGEEMENGLKELLNLSEWANKNSYSLDITPIRFYYDIEKEEKVKQIFQGEFEHWM